MNRGPIAASRQSAANPRNHFQRRSAETSLRRASWCQCGFEKTCRLRIGYFINIAFTSVLCSFALSTPAYAASSPAASRIDDCQYEDNGAAQAAWRPMRGSEPASVGLIGGGRFLRLACNFTNATIERSSWDHQVTLDLSTCQGIQFKILCRDASPVSYFSIFFQSGEGWYHAAFFPESSTDWNTISIEKTEFSTEGKPAGWGRITAIRVSAWRGRDAHTEFYLSDIRQIGVLGEDASVAILRADSVIQQRPDETRSVNQSAETVAQNLRELDLGCAVMSDLNVSSQYLNRARLVILPFNPSLPEKTAEALIRYLGQGGKLLGFYSVAEKLRPFLKLEPGQHIAAAYAGQFSAIHFGVGALPGAPAVVGQRSWNINAFRPVSSESRVLAEWFDDKGQPSGYPAVLGSSNYIVMTHVLLPDDPSNKRRMLLAMMGRLVPEIWRQSAESEIAHLGVFGGFKTFDDAAEQIAKLRSDSRATQKLEAARRARELAIELTARQEFVQAMDQSAAASQLIKEAFCMAQQPATGEFRAFWCHSAFGVQGMDWDHAIATLADNGFNAILPNMLWGGVAFYPSRILPVAPQVAERGDQIAQCVAACHKHGIRVHVWKVNWNLGDAAPKEFVAQLRREGRLQASLSGKELRWLCPSHPENQKMEIDSMVEVARNYDVDGIHFDYIRYPDGDHCFCGACRERFQQAAGLKVRNWPKDVLADGPLRQQWLDWRRDNITAVVKGVSEKVRAIKPTIRISAAVFSNWAADRDGVGQDWKLWCEKGYLDFVCPMDYTPSNGSFENMVTRQVQWANRTPCYPGIGVSASSSHFGVDRVIEQINITRRAGTHGFAIFNYGVAESKELLPLLGLGITAKQ